MHGEHLNGGMMEIDSYNVEFLDEEFLNTCEIKKDIKLHELQ